MTIKKILLGLLTVFTLVILVSGYVLTREGELKTPSGTGTIALDAGTFEELPLPDYAASFVSDAYKSYLVEVAPGIKIHVLEVGEGYPVYMQHGAPTSGFLYRQVAENLPLDQFRVIMPTLVGFGFSTKTPVDQHTVENHITWMNALLGKLALTDLIFIGHDWGGPIGMGALARSPDLMKGMVMLNTVLDAPKVDRKVGLPLKLARTPVVGEFMLEGLVSVFDQLSGFQNDPASIPASVVELYGKPLYDSGNAKGPLALIRQAVISPDHPDAALFRAIETYVRSNQVPTEIVWGMNDPILGARLTDMQTILPEASVVETEAGHFLQEEAPKDIALSVQRVRALITP